MDTEVKVPLNYIRQAHQEPHQNNAIGKIAVAPKQLGSIFAPRSRLNLENWKTKINILSNGQIDDDVRISCMEESCAVYAKQISDYPKYSSEYNTSKGPQGRKPPPSSSDVASK